MESRSSLVLVIALASLAACRVTAPSARPELAIAAALGLPHPISLRIEGQPVDAPGEDGSSLSLATALALGLENSPEIQAALARVRAALADADQARLLPNPLLEFVLRVPEGGGRADLEVGVATDLLAVLRRGRGVAAADRRLARAVSEAVATSTGVAMDVQERFFSARALDELLPLLRERRAVVAKLVEVARSRSKFGEGSRIDVAVLEARGLEVEIEMRERESEARDGRLALARRIGRPSSAAQWSFEQPSAPVGTIGEEQAWIALSLEHRPEVQALRLELSALSSEAESVGASTWSGLTVGVNAERGDEWSFGPALSAPLPLFDDGSARRSRAEALVIEARHELVNTERRVVEDVRRAVSLHETAYANLVHVRDELIPLQRSRREQVEAAYRAGHVDIGAVLSAEQDLLAARVKLVDVEKRVFVSLAHLERAVGGAGVAQRVSESKESKR